MVKGKHGATNNDIVRPSHFEYASPPVPIVDGHKGDGELKPRICFDYQALNVSTVSDKFPMPDVDEELVPIGTTITSQPWTL